MDFAVSEQFFESAEHVGCFIGGNCSLYTVDDFLNDVIGKINAEFLFNKLYRLIFELLKKIGIIKKNNLNTFT